MRDMINQVQIRRATEVDIPAMSCLWESLVLEENDSANPNKEAWSEMQRDLMQNPAYYAYVTETQGVIVGFATGLLTMDLEHKGELILEGGHMFVSHLYRKGKAGALLHRMGTEVARKHGAKRFRRHVPASNDRMVKRLQRRKYIVREFTVDEGVGG